VRHARFQRLEELELRIGSVGCGLLSRRSKTAHLADPGDQSLAVAQRDRRPSGFGGRDGYRRRSASVIGRITSEPLSTCWRTISSFSARFSSARSRVVFAPRRPEDGAADEAADAAGRR
jgi:hypothetical protein